MGIFDGPYTKGMNIHGPTYKDKLIDNVHRSEMGSRLPGQFYTNEVKRAEDEGLLTPYGVPEDISIFNKVSKLLGIDNPITSSRYGYGSFENKNNEEIFKDVSTGPGVTFPIDQADRLKFDRLIKRGLLKGPDGVLSSGGTKDASDKQYRMFRKNPELYSLTRDIPTDIKRLNNLEDAAQHFGKEIESAAGQVGKGLLGLDNTVKGNFLPIDDSVFGPNTGIDSFNGTILLQATPDNYLDYEKVLSTYKPELFNQYKFLKEKQKTAGDYYGRGYLQQEIDKIEKKLFNKNGTVTLMEGLFEDHTRILKDAVANESTAYAMGQLTQLGIEFIPGVGLFGLSGIKKGGQVIKLAFKNGKLNKKSVDALKNAKLTNNQIKAIEAKNAEAVVRKLKYNPETGMMDITDPNVAFMSKTDDMPLNIDKAIANETATTGVVGKSAIDDAVATLTSKNKGKPLGVKNITQEQKNDVIKLKTDNPNITTQEIVKLTNLGKSSIGNILKDVGLTVNPTFTADEIKNIIQLRKQGLSIKEISEQTGKSKSPINKIMKNNKLRDVDIKVSNMNETAKNFDPNNQATWKNSLLIVRDSTGPKETRRFLFPENEQVKKTIVEFINENIRSGTRGSGVTVGELAETLGMPKNGLSTAIKNLAKDTDLIKKYVKSTNTGDKDDLRNQLEKIWRTQNPEEAKELALLRREVKKLNDELGLTGYDRFEVDHIRSIIDDYHNTGAVDFSTKNVQIIPKFVNQGGFQRNGKNLIDLPEYTSKFKIFENSKFGIRKLYKDLQKPNITAKEKKEIQKAIREQWNTWSEIVDDHEVLFDFTNYKGKLPDEYLIKNKPDGFDAFEQLYNLSDDLIGQESSKLRQEYLDTLLADGGRVRQKRIEAGKGFATGTRDGALVGDDITGDTIYGQYLTNLNLTMDKRLRDQDNMDRILEAPKSMQRAVAMTLYDEDEAAFLEEIRQMPSSVRAEFKQKVLDAQEIQKSLAETLRDERPVKFPVSSVPKLVTDNVMFKGLLKRQMMPTIVFKNFFDDLIGREGPENAEKIAPNVSKYINLGPTPKTPPEQAYIDGIDEFNRALETGVTNIGFSVMDLILGGVDLATKNNFALTEKLQKLYDEKGINEPETFLGDMTALLVEFGVPGGVVSKLLTRAQKAMRLNGVNTMTRYLDPDLTGSAKRAIQFTNLASRVGTGAVVFGATDFIAGGPNNSLKRMFPDDSTLLPGKPERTDDLTGGDLVAANFRNRLRFAADGALIGAAFPLVGPPLYGVIKGTAKLPFKTIPGINRSVVGGTLQLAGVPLRIAADVLAGKIPYTQTMIPAVGKAISKTGEKTASAIQSTAAFVGKNVFARAALASQDAMFFRDSIYSGINRGTTFARGLPKVFGGEGGGLPAFQEWRKFSVNSADPLHANLARIDNKLALFRDIGKLTKDAFALSTKSQNFIKAKSRTIDKLYTNLEQITYRLAKKFEEQHKKWGQFDIIQKKYLDDVLDYLKGNKKIENIDPPLRDAALELKEYYRKLMTEFKDLLPDGDKLKTLLTQDIDSQMKRSFAAFTNSNFRPGAENVKAARDYIANFIKQDTSLQAEAKIAFPNAKNLDEAINSLAELKVADLMHVARYEMEDPIRALRKITSKLETSGVRGLVDPLEIFTGQELPAVIRQLMGEEKNLKNSLMQTTGNVIASTQQKQALDRIAKLGLENGWLFNSAEDALTKGKIFNSIPVGDIKGAGFLPSDILGLYGTPEMVKQLSGYSIFDSALKYKFYQNILAFKAMVQGGKTLYSPATQMRNFGSAGLFAMNVGHIGGKTSVTQNFKIMLDDIFGSGPNINQSDLIKFIERKIELGVLDENVVAQELGGVLRDLKGVIGKDGKPVISNFNNLTQRIGDAKLSQTVQRLYAGGDNVWKAYGHEFYMSELKQFTKSLNDVSNFFRTQVGREWEPMKNGVKKTLAEGIEEMAAHLLRETYPTYSRVPPAIQALRKLPIGNFISFPAEMIRTSLATTASSMKMIGSGNPGLQAMGYRALMGQFTTLYGFNHGAQKLASKMTGVGEDKLRAYQDDLGPSFIDDHILIPITKQNEDGTFKAFDASTYNPYNYLVGPVEQFIRELGSTRLDPAQVDSELDRRFFDAGGSFMKLLEPFISETIALEPILDIYARNGVSRDGKKIFSPLDSPSDKREKSIYHIFETIAPGFIRSASQVYGALTLDTKSGKVMELGDVLIRLMGGSIMNIDPVTALDYKAIDIRQIRGAAFQTEAFFSKDNALSRGPILDEKGRQVGHVMANELRDIQEEAFVAQFGIWKMFHKSLASGLLTEEQIKKVLGKKGRNVPNLKKLMDGEFTPVSFSKDGLKKRANDLVKEYEARGIDVNYEDLYPYYDLLEVIDEFKYRRFEDFLDPARPPLDEIPFDINSISQTPTPPTQEIPVAPLDTSDFADTQIVAAPKQTVVGANNQQVNNQTGLTRNEEALLSPSDRFYRRSQRGKI